MGPETELISIVEATIARHWPDKQQNIEGVPTLEAVAAEIVTTVLYAAFPQRAIQGVDSDGIPVIDEAPAVKYVHTIHAPQTIIDRLLAGEDMLGLTREEFFDAPGEWTALGVDADTAKRFAAIGSASEDGAWI